MLLYYVILYGHLFDFDTMIFMKLNQRDIDFNAALFNFI